MIVIKSRETQGQSSTPADILVDTEYLQVKMTVLVSLLFITIDCKIGIFPYICHTVQ